MELRVFTEPQQGATYEDLLTIALAAEELGFAAFFRSDHYLSVGTDGLPGPTDAWTSLAGLARDTTSIRLGTMMTSATFRLPGPLAITVAGVDQMSGGRVELGLGAGWFAEEHTAYGIPFPDTAERFDRFEEQLSIISGLWATPIGGRLSHDGPHYPIQDSPALPKPVQQPGPPIIIGGKGARRTPQLAARFASEFNVPFASVEVNRTQIARVREACVSIGRDPDDLTYSAALTVCCGSDEAEVRRRAAAIGDDYGELCEKGLTGTPDELVETIASYAEVGVRRLYLQVLDLADLDHLRLLAAEVMPRV